MLGFLMLISTVGILSFGLHGAYADTKQKAKIVQQKLLDQLEGKVA